MKKALTEKVIKEILCELIKISQPTHIDVFRVATQIAKQNSGNQTKGKHIMKPKKKGKGGTKRGGKGC